MFAQYVSFLFTWKMFRNIAYLSTTASRIDGFTLVLECYCNGSSSGFGMSWCSQSIQMSWRSALQRPTWLTLIIRARICFLREMLDVEQIVGKYRFQTSCNSGYTCQGEKMALEPGLARWLEIFWMFWALVDCIQFSLPTWNWNITSFWDESHPLTIASTWPGQCVYFQVDNREFQSFRIFGWKNWERGFKNMVEA